MSNKRKVCDGDDDDDDDNNCKKKSIKQKKILTKEIEYYTEEQVKSRITANNYLRFSIPYDNEIHDWYEWWQRGDVQERGQEELEEMELDGKYKIPFHQWDEMSIKKIYVSNDSISNDSEKRFLIKLPVKEIVQKIYQCKRCQTIFEKKNKTKLTECKGCYQRVCYSCMKICFCVNCRIDFNDNKYYCKEECYSTHESEPKERKCPSCLSPKILDSSCKKCWSHVRICGDCCKKCDKICCHNESTDWDIGRFCISHYNKKHK